MDLQLSKQNVELGSDDQEFDIYGENPYKIYSRPYGENVSFSRLLTKNNIVQAYKFYKTFKTEKTAGDKKALVKKFMFYISVVKEKTLLLNFLKMILNFMNLYQKIQSLAMLLNWENSIMNCW